MKKYELTGETEEIGGKILHRIRALIDIPKHDVKAGDLGGWLETEGNLSHNGAAWVTDSARVTDSACVTGSAWVTGSVCVTGLACVTGSALVTGKACVTDSACVTGSAWVTDEARVTGKALVTGEARVTGSALVTGKACVTDSARVTGKALVTGEARVTGSALVTGEARVTVNAWVRGNARVMESSDCITIGAIGSRDDTTTFYRGTDGGIYVSCGCFSGSVDDFAAKVKAVHAGTKHEKTYLLAIELAKAQIGTAEEKR